MKFPYTTALAVSPGMHGLYRISHEAYHAGFGLSSSKLKAALVSYDTYMQEEKSDSASMSFGRAFHAALIEPEHFKAKWEILPQGPTSKAYKDAVAEGRNVVSEAELELVQAMCDAVRAHPDYGTVCKGDGEIMAVTTCMRTGMTIKCKADILSNSIVDFKSTSASINPSDFLYEIVKYKYHLSAAFYQDIVMQVTGVKMPFVLIPVTKKENPECEFYELSDELLDEGRTLYKAALDRIIKWNTKPETRAKKLRKLYPNGRVMQVTRDIVDFVSS